MRRILQFSGVKMDPKTLWLNSPKTIRRSRKPYAHFDSRTCITDQWSYISDPSRIATHGFWPFIHYKREYIRYNKKAGKTKKYRDICYASHIDSCIFQYYSFLLNELYNRRLAQKDLHLTAIAYRSNLPKQSNLHFARRAFDFIREQNQCYVMIGDFTGFFDNLDHSYLKERWADLLEAEQLPADHYAVFKNITRYSVWERESLLAINGLENNRKGIRELNSKKKVLSLEQFKEGKKNIEKNPNSYGIPQGSPISAVLANIYMLEADDKIQAAINLHGGLYMRYSDDFIAVIPADNAKAIQVLEEVKQIIGSIPRLELEPRKTQYYYYNNGGIENCGKLIDTNANTEHDIIFFLGASFDGQTVRIRQKAITKYYYRMYRKGKWIRRQKGISPKGKQISNRNLYEKYSQNGQQNFLSYIDRAHTVFSDQCFDDKVISRHMQRIRRAISH